MPLKAYTNLGLLAFVLLLTDEVANKHDCSRNLTYTIRIPSVHFLLGHGLLEVLNGVAATS